MRTTGMLVALAVMLGLSMPAAAAPPDMVQAAPEMLTALDGMGSGGNLPMMRAPGRPGGWQRGFGPFQGFRRPSFIRMVLMNQRELDLTAQQVDSLRKLGFDAGRAAIRRRADLQTAMLDLMDLRWSNPVDMGKVEAKVREIERVRGDGTIARIRTAEAVKGELTADQREKLKSLWSARWQRRGSGEGGAQDAAVPDQDK